MCCAPRIQARARRSLSPQPGKRAVMLDQYLQVHLVPRDRFDGTADGCAGCFTATLGTPDAPNFMSFTGA